MANAATDDNGDTALHIAAREGHGFDVESLLNAGAPLDAVNNNRETPLHVAVREGKLHIVELLVDLGARLDLTNNAAETPLHIAAEVRHWNIAELLIDKGAPLDAKNCHGETALHVAVRKPHWNIVEHLVNSGAQLDLKNNDEETALYIAAKKNKWGVVEFLIDSGAQVCSPPNKETVLHLAVSARRLDVTIILVNSGAVEREIEELFTNINSRTVFIFTQKFTLYKNKCRREDIDLMLAYALLYFPDLELTHFAEYDLDSFKNELVRMKTETLSVDSKISLHKLLLEKDKDVLASFVTCVERQSADITTLYELNFPIYASMLLRKLYEGKKRQILLFKFNLIMDHCDSRDLPCPARRNLTKFLTNSDLGLLVSAAEDAIKNKRKIVSEDLDTPRKRR